MIKQNKEGGIMMKTLLKTVLLILLLAMPFYGQEKEQTSTKKPKPRATTIEATTKDGRAVILMSDGTWKFVNGSSTSTTSTKNTINIEAAIVYKNGDVVPVARTEIYLLKQSLKDILGTPELKKLYQECWPDQTEEISLASLVAGFTLLADKCTNYAPAAQAALMNAVDFKTTTDFAGKASLINIPKGSYFLYTYYQTRKNPIIWYIPVTVENGENKLVLDNNNSSSFF